MMNINSLKKTLEGLGNDAHVNDEVVSYFYRLFNEWEYKKFLIDPGYSGAATIWLKPFGFI